MFSPQAIQDVDEFVSSSEQICINLALLPFKKPIQNKASGVMLNFSKSVPAKKQTHIHPEWPEGKYIFSKCDFFLVNYSFNFSLVN